jgi:hypothetical protein
MQQNITTTNNAFWSLEMGLKAKQAKDGPSKAQLQQAFVSGGNITIRSFGNTVTTDRKIAL